jgi:YD repeat-containing protein
MSTRILAAVVALLLASIDQGAKAADAYTYDLAGRLTTALYENGMCVVYSYDAAGNRTAQTNTLDGPAATPVYGTGAYGCFLWPVALPAALYDSAGNAMRDDQGNVMEWQ